LTETYAGSKGLVRGGGGVHALEGVHDVVQLVGAVVDGDLNRGRGVGRGGLGGGGAGGRLRRAGSGQLGEEVIHSGGTT